MHAHHFMILLLCIAAGCSAENETKPASSETKSRSQPSGVLHDEPVSTAGSQQGKIPDAEGFVAITPANVTLFSPSTEKGTIGFERDVDSIALAGDARGYLHSNKPYRDFTLRLEFRWPNAAELPEDERPNANTGVLVFITGEDKIWPRCLEVQGKWSELGHIKSNAKDVTVEVRDDQAAREQARKPIDEWNSLEIVSKDGALTSILNGVKVAESDPTELREGRIGFQAERFDVEFRNVRIREE